MNDQLSMLADLDRASDTREPNLCKTWQNAVLNDCDVFVDGMQTFEAHPKDKFFPCVEIHCALEYPKVYYSFSVTGNTAGFGSYPGRLDENFDVHEHPANVMLMVEHSLASHIGKDKTMQRLMREALDKMELEIKK